MPREDSLSSRVDYLFEPLDVDESPDGAEGTGAAVAEAAGQPESSGSTAPVRMAFAAFVVATLGAAAVVAVLLSQRPQEDTDPVVVPLEQAPSPTRSASPRETHRNVTISPATRASISVAPETRTPFPNQQSRPGGRPNGGGGGHLGGLL